jgi:hypothetical protein
MNAVMSAGKIIKKAMSHTLQADTFHLLGIQAYGQLELDGTGEASQSSSNRKHLKLVATGWHLKLAATGRVYISAGRSYHKGGASVLCRRGELKDTKK